jgi:hypothetical protein
LECFIVNLNNAREAIPIEVFFWRTLRHLSCKTHSRLPDHHYFGSLLGGTSLCLYCTCSAIPLNRDCNIAFSLSGFLRDCDSRSSGGAASGGLRLPHAVSVAAAVDNPKVCPTSHRASTAGGANLRPSLHVS